MSPSVPVSNAAAQSTSLSDFSSGLSDLGDEVSLLAGQNPDAEAALSDIDTVARQLLDQYGETAVQQSVTAATTLHLANEIKNLVEASDLSDGARSIVNDYLDGVVSEATGDALTDISDELATYMRSADSGSSLDEASEAISGLGNGTDAGGAAATLTSQLTADNDGDSGSSGTSGPNWLEALAKGLAEVQSKWISKAQDSLDQMNESSSGEGSTASSEFLTAQSEYTASMQLFSLTANATSTSLKTLGEGLASIARKQ